MVNPPPSPGRVNSNVSVTARSLNAVKSNYVGTVVHIAAQFIAQIFITRELGPELVGTFGYALLLYGVLSLVIDQGFGWSLIQGSFDDADEIAIVFSRLMLVSLGCGIAVYGLSYPIARVLDNALAGQVLRYVAPSYLLIGLYVVAQAKLRAELRFSEIQQATTGGYLLGYAVVGVVLALAGFGVWSLVTAWYTAAILQVIIAFCYSPHSIRLGNPFKATKSGPLARQVAGINLLNWSVDNASGTMVGSLGAIMLGNFNAAMMLSRTPTVHLVQTLQSILFSTASAVRDDREMIRRMYLGALTAVGFVVIPAYTYAALHAEFIIGVVFGPGWTDAVTVFPILSVGMIALSFRTLSGPILTAIGAHKAVLWSQLPALLIVLVGLYVATHTLSRHGLFYVGLSVALGYTTGLLIQLAVLTKRKVLVPSELVHAIKGPCLIAALMGAPVEMWFDAGQYTTVCILGTLLLKSVTAGLFVKQFPKFLLGGTLLDALSNLKIGRRVLGVAAR